MRRQYRKPFAGLVIKLLMVGGFNVLSAQAEAVSFTLVNPTDRVLKEFYASPQSSNSWEADILGRDVLKPGQSVEFTINDGRS